MWYLSEELVVFAIFEYDLPSALRLNMVPRLLCILRPTRYISQKPKFPKFDPLLIDFPRQLITFLGQRNWLLFYLLKLKEEQLDWMHSTSVDNWEKFPDIKQRKKIVRSREVVNHTSGLLLHLPTASITTYPVLIVWPDSTYGQVLKPSMLTAISA